MDTTALARNSAASGPVAEGGTRALETSRAPWIARDPRPPPLARPTCLRVVNVGSPNRCLAMTPDARLAVSPVGDTMRGRHGGVRIWEVGSGATLHLLEGPAGGPAAALAISQDGSIVAAVTRQTLTVWDVATGDRMWNLCAEEHHDLGGEISVPLDSAVALSTDCRRALTLRNNTTLREWDLKAGTLVGTWSLPVSVSAAGPHMAATPDLSKVAIGEHFEPYAIIVWDREEASVVARFLGHRERVDDVALTLDGSRVASASADGTVRVWGVCSGNCIQVLDAGSGRLHAVAMSGDGRTVVAAGRDQSVHVWDVPSGRLLRHLQGHCDHVEAVGTSEDGAVVLSASKDGTVRVWHALSADAPAQVAASLWHPPVSPDGVAVFAQLGGKTHLFDLRTKEIHEWLPNRAVPIASSADGRLVALPSPWGPAIVDVSSGAMLRKLAGDSLPRAYVDGFHVPVAAFVGGGHLLVCSNHSGPVVLRLWDLATGDCVGTVSGRGTVRALAATPNGKLVAAAFTDASIILVDLASGAVTTLRGGGVEYHLVFTPDSRALVSGNGDFEVPGSGDYVVRVWDLSSKKCHGALAGHRWSVTGLSVTPDGSQVLSASLDGTVRLWALTTGECRAVYHAGAEVGALTHVLPDGQFAISTTEPRIHHLQLRNCSMGPPRITAAQRFRFDATAGSGESEGEWSGRCPWCASSFQAEERTVETIDGILESTCPRYAKALVFNSLLPLT